MSRSKVSGDDGSTSYIEMSERKDHGVTAPADIFDGGDGIELWNVSRGLSAYLRLFLVAVTVSVFAATFYCVRWGFVSIDDTTSPQSWFFFVVSAMHRWIVSWITYPLTFTYAIHFIPTNDQATLSWTSRLWPRSYGAFLGEIVVIVGAVHSVPIALELRNRIAQNFSTSLSVNQGVSFLMMQCWMSPLVLFFAACNPYSRVNRTHPAVTAAGADADAVDNEAPWKLSVSRFPFVLWTLLTLSFVSLSVFTAIIQDPTISPIFRFGTVVVQCIILPTAALYSIVNQPPLSSVTSQLVDLAYTSLLCVNLVTVLQHFTGAVRAVLITIRQTQSSTIDETAALFSFIYYLLLTLLMYCSRIVGQRALPRGASLAILAIWQFYEETFADLIFLTFNPFDAPFFLLSFLQICKTLLRDLDAPTESYYWLKRQWRSRIRPPSNNVPPTSSSSGEMEAEYAHNIWRRDYDQFLLRHQNFCCEMSSKLAVITVLLFDVVFADSATQYSPIVTPAICTSAQALEWSNHPHFASCLPVCSQLPATVYDVLRQTQPKVGFGIGCYEQTYPPPQMQFDLRRRILLVSALLFSMALQICTHFFLLFCLKWFQRRRQENGTRIQETPQQTTRARLTDPLMSSNSPPSSLSSPPTIVPLRMRDYWDNYWVLMLLFFVMSIQNVIIEARAVAYLTTMEEKYLR